MKNKFNVKSFIEVPFNFYYKHKYENAPEEVRFLRELHNHQFDCKVNMEVFHDNREQEFYMVRNYLESIVNFIKGEIKRNDFKYSCEMISDIIHTKLIQKYGMRDIIISVKEDNVYGSTKSYEVIKE